MLMTKEQIEKLRTYLEDTYPDHDFKWTANGIKCLCPNPDHDDHVPSMCLLMNKQGIPSYHCFGCGMHGVLPEQFQDNPLTRFQRMTQKKPETVVERSYDICFTDSWKDIPEVKKYVLSRVSESVADDWNLRAFNTTVYFPDRWENSTTNYYQTRDVTQKNYGGSVGIKPLMKLLAFYRERLILVEGCFDAMTMGREGVALVGTALTNRQMQQLKDLYLTRMPPKELILMLDGGAKERSIQQQLIKKIMRLRPILLRSQIWIAELPDGEDPNSLGKEEALRYLKKVHP